MYRKTVSAILMSLLVLGTLTLFFNIHTVWASETIYIRADGSVDPPTASITTVDNVTYVLTDNVYDSVVVERNDIVVDGTGYTVTGSGNGNGVTLTDRTNVTVRNMTIKNFHSGIHLASSSNDTLSGNNATANNWYGISLDSCFNNTLSGNNVTANNHAGIILFTGGSPSSDGNVLSGNNVADNDYGIELHESWNNTLSGNNVTANRNDGIVLAGGEYWCHSNVLSGNNVANNGGGIVLTGSTSNNVLSGNNVTANNNDGIVLDEGSFNNILSGNSVTANRNYGILLSPSVFDALPNNSLSGNVMRGNRYNFEVYGYTLSNFLQSVDASNLVDDMPVYYFVNQSDLVVNPAAYPEVGYLGLVNCDNVTVQGLNLTNNGQGLLLVSTKDSKIAGNNVANNHDGIFLDYSSNNSISGNNITNNSYRGILLDSSSNYNSISGNNLINNYWGIDIAPGRINWGIEFGSCSSNRIYHNNFVNNTFNVENENSSDTAANIWDNGYPSGGNYWSDFNGTDSNHDGIGDSNYTIDANNVDRYPLMGTFNSFSASWEQSVETICNSTISGFAFNGTAMSFNVSGDPGTTGFCRIYIPTGLMNGSYDVFVNGTKAAYTLLSFFNDTHEYLYFSYTHSTQQVIVVPEFPTLTILLLLFTLSALTILSAKKRTRKHST